MNSAAYKNLSGTAAKALPYFKWVHGVLVKRLGDDYNGIFDFTYSLTVNNAISKMATFGNIWQRIDP